MPWRRRVARDETLVAAPPPGPPPEAVPPPREWWPWLLALLILVLGGLVAGWLLTRDDDENDKSATTVVVTRPTESTTTTAATIAVPAVVGMQSPKAIETLRTKGLKGIVHSVAADQASGVVVAQDPNAGTQVKRGAQVNLDVSKGPEDVTVPNVVGKTEQQALDQLRTAGFAVTTFDVPAADPQGTVVAQDPAGDTKAKRGARVRINVSTGKTTGSTTPRPPGPPPPPPPPPTTPAAVTVPNLVGQNRKTAAEQVRSLGLKVVIRYVPSEEAVGTVVSQSPAAGTTAKRGGGVLINLSFGPGGEETAKVVPGVIGKDEQTARSTLEGAGFVVEVWRLRVSSPSQNGKVVDEQPGGGQKAPQGSTVTITVGSTSG